MPGLPTVLVLVAVKDGAVTDPHHVTGSVVLLAVEVLVSVGIGIGWTFTTRVWTDERGDGRPRSWC